MAALDDDEPTGLYSADLSKAPSACQKAIERYDMGNVLLANLGSNT